MAVSRKIPSFAYLGFLLTWSDRYWDQSLDIADFTASPVFNDWIGFGGNGVDEGGDPIIPGSTGGGCIGSGLFRNHRTHIDYADRDTPGINRCIKRAIAPMIASLWQTQAKLDLVLAEPTYEEMAVTLEGDVEFPDPLPKMGMHNSGHTTIGGDMTDMFVSPGDPIFWLHHANIDRIWALWQAQDSARQYAVGNPIAPRPNPMLVWPDAPSGNVTPAFPLVRLKVPGTSTQALVGHVLNTVGKGVTVPGTNIVGELCYQYV